MKLRSIIVDDSSMQRMAVAKLVNKDYIVGKTCLEEMLTMTAIRVNNKMKAEDVVDIDTKEEGRFMITKEGFVRCVFDTNND